MSFNMSAKWKWRSEVAFLSLAATSMLALTCPEPALAQTGAAAGDEPESTDIVVTAQRSEERLQDVPISISVLSGDALEQSRAQGLTEVLRTVPGVAAPIGALGQPVLTIRGVTASSLAFAGASTAGVYFDSAPYGFVRSALAPDADIYDLSRIEVLRGPQGTLFGANAQSGVIRILTQDPNLSGFEFKARGSVASTHKGGTDYRGDAAANLPIIEDKLAARLVVGYNDRSGWVDKPGIPDADGTRVSNIRLKVKAQPTDRLSVVASSMFTRYRADSQSIGLPGGINTVAGAEPVRTDTDLYGLKVEYEFPAFTLTSATNYLKYDIASSLDISAFFPPPAQVVQTVGFSSEVFSQEVYLSSAPGGDWRWSLGGSFRDGKDLFTRDIGGPLLGSYNDYSKSWAVFGEVTRLLLDGKVELTAGLRYFRDRQRTKENISSTGNPAAPLVDARTTFSAWTPRAVVTWHANSDLTIYGTYSQGFRSGLVQSPEVQFQAPTFPAVRPDRLHNFELGAKGKLLDGAITFDSAIYYLKWKGVQQSLNVIFNGINLVPVLNGGSASGPGFEMSAIFAPVRGLSLTTSFSFNDLTFDENVISGGTVIYPKGARLSNSPEYTAGGALAYTFPMGGSFDGEFAFSGNYTSRIKGDPSPASSGKSITILRSSFKLSAPENWALTLFIDNITNDIDPTSLYVGVPTWSALNTRPRTIGAQVDFKF